MPTVIDRIPNYPGRVVLTPVPGQANTYDMTRADAPVVAGTPVNKSLFDQINLEISAITDLIFTNKTVLTSAWAADTTYTDYPFRASVPLTGVLATMIPTVVAFEPNLTDFGLLAPIARSYNGGLYIYALSVPSATVTVETIMLKKAPNTSYTDTQNVIVDSTTGITYRLTIVVDNGIPQIVLDEVTP